MLNRNYYERLITFAMCISGYDVGRTVKNTDGQVVTIVCPDNSRIGNYTIENNLKQVSTDGYYNVNVVFGNGTAEPTVDDYKLSGEIISGISVTPNVTREETANGAKCTGVYTITNNNDHDITISEVALSNYVPISSTGTNGRAIYDRTLLDAPVTIPANGGVGQVRYSISMDLPNFA